MAVGVRLGLLVEPAVVVEEGLEGLPVAAPGMPAIASLFVGVGMLEARRPMEVTEGSGNAEVGVEASVVVMTVPLMVSTST